MADYKKPDFWQQKARKEGYPARSVYKLEEIDKKFDLLKQLRARTKGLGFFRALDIGASPGSWSLYILLKMAQMKTRTRTAGTDGSMFLAAVDLSPLSREFYNELKVRGLIGGDNFFFVQGDITDARVRQTLVLKGKYSVITSDVAPSTTGNRMVDTARSFDLANAVIGYAESALAEGGALTLKVFQSGDSAVLLKKMKTLFDTVKTFKPQACRDNSMETYFIGLGRKAASGAFPTNTA